MEHTDFFTLFTASSLTGIPIEVTRNVKMKDFKFPEDIENNIAKKSEFEFSSFKFIPNKKYVKMEFHSVFNFNINSIRRELDIYLFSEEANNIDDYPFQLFIKQSSSGEINFKINAHMAKKITDILRFNDMMTLWSEQGLRRLRIHNAVNCETITIVPDKIDADKIKTAEILKKIIDKAQLTIDEIPNIKSRELINIISSLEPSTMNTSDCLKLINEIKNQTYKEQTNISILLKKEDGKIIFSRSICTLPFFVNLDFINVKPTNKDGKDILKKAINRDLDISLEKFICGDTLENYFKEMVNIFKRSDFSFNTALSKFFDNQNNNPIGKCLLQINSITNRYWNKEQNISFVIKYADGEINTLMELNNLLSSKDLITAIPLMQQKEDKFLENLAFAFYLKKDYKLSLDYCNRSINKDFHSVAHFTKGLIFLAENKFDEAYECYMHGIYLNKSDIWYPTIKDNIEFGIKNGQIIDNENVKTLLNTIELYRRRTYSKITKKCFCGSRKNYFICHGKDYTL